MGDWADLPNELLHLICQLLTSSIDLLRFRSICSNWRSAAALQFAVSSRFPILPNAGISNLTWGFYLSKRTVYLIQSTLSHHHLSWIIKLESDNWTQMHLLNPLTRLQFKPLPDDFPKLFSFLNFRVKELGQEYALQYIDYRPMANSIGEAGNLYMEKVAVVLDVTNNNKAFMLLTIHLSGKLVVYRSGDEKWRGIVSDSPSPYDDVIFMQGKFYAVDITGRVVVVNCDELSAEVIASSIFGGDKKFLLDSDGELLLVDMYLSDVVEDDSVSDDWLHEDSDSLVTERASKFKVFRLDDNAGKWIEVNDLGDRILFLGENSTFSVNASEVFGDHRCKGNCILFTNQCGGRADDEVWRNRGAGVFYLDKGSIEPISSQSDYCKMFWPPPDWVCLSTLIEDGVNQLDI